MSETAARQLQGEDDRNLRILFDGECPLCALEIAMLRRLDRGRGRIGRLYASRRRGGRGKKALVRFAYST